MAELTSGELRYIDESLNTWRFWISEISGYMDEVPAEVKKHIDELSDQFKAEFVKFFAAEKDKNPNPNGGEISAAFDEQWNKEHPEFFDMKALFSGCSASDLEKAAEAIKKAEDFFTPAEV